MKVLLNGANLSTGGGVQVFLDLITSLNDNELFEVVVVAHQRYLHLLPPELNILSIKEVVGSIDYRFALDHIVINSKPDLVFTVFGPSYWRPKNATHIVGFAKPLLPGWHFNLFKVFGWKIITVLVKNVFQCFLILRQADFLWTETNHAREFLTRFTKKRIWVVPNAINSNLKYIKAFDTFHSSFRIGFIGANYPHKNLDRLVGYMRRFRKETSIDIQLLIASNEKVEESFVENLGYLKTDELHRFYTSCDLIVLPSSLEVMSATPLEALFYHKPVLIGDFSFNKEYNYPDIYFFDVYSYNSFKHSVLSLVMPQSFKSQLRQEHVSRKVGITNLLIDVFNHTKP